MILCMHEHTTAAFSHLVQQKLFADFYEYNTTSLSYHNCFNYPVKCQTTVPNLQKDCTAKQQQRTNYSAYNQQKQATWTPILPRGGNPTQACPGARARRTTATLGQTSAWNLGKASQCDCIS